MLPHQVLTTLRSLTSSLFGIASGILGLESLSGFLFYILGTLFVSALIWGLRADGLDGVRGGQEKLHGNRGHGKYFENPYWELWAGGADLWGGLSSFVLTWTLFYGLVRA